MFRSRLPRLLRRLLLIVIAIISLLALLSLILYLSLVYRPAAYQPQPLSPQRQEQIEHEALVHYQDLYNNVNLNEPFTLVFEQQWLNQLLLHRRVRDFLDQNTANTRLSQPQISLTDNRLNLMARIQHDSHAFIITLTLVPTLDQQQHLHLRFLPPRAGALPLPHRLVDDVARRLVHLIERLLTVPPPPHSSSDDQVLDDLRRQLLPHLQELIRTRHTTITPAFTATPEGRSARLTDLHIDAGRITLELLPLPPE